MLNPYSEEERLQAMVSAAYRAARAHFSHLPIRDIISPPVDMFDAKLARQIAVHILNVEFGIPHRRLVSVLGVSRFMVMQSVRTVDRRCEEPVFERAYDRIASRAHDMFMTGLQEAAADDGSEAA